MRKIICLTSILTALSLSAMAQNNGVDPEVLIDLILQVDASQRNELSDMRMDAVLIEGDRKGDSLVESSRFVKKVYVKYVNDTAWFHEDYLEYFDNGEKKSDQDCADEGMKKKEKKKKRKSLDVSYPMLKPFYRKYRELYTIEYKGVSLEPIDGYACHHFQVRAVEPDERRLNGDFYFEAEGFHLVRVDFQPSKLVKNLMFRLNKLDMSLTFMPNADGLWFPEEFNIDGKGKVGFLFGVSFSGTEIYSNPVVNIGLSDDKFREELEHNEREESDD